MKLFRYDKNLNLVLADSVDESEVLELLNTCYEAGFRDYKMGEDALQETFFLIEKAEGDFLGFCCHGDNHISIDSDRLVYQNWFVRLITRKRHIWMEVGLDRAREILRDYFASEREDFELKHWTAYSE